MSGSLGLGVIAVGTLRGKRRRVLGTSSGEEEEMFSYAKEQPEYRRSRHREVVVWVYPQVPPTVANNDK